MAAEARESPGWIRVVTQGHANIAIIIMIVFLASLASSIWADTALAAYLLQVTGSNATVGGIEAVSGVSQMVSALPVGLLADKLGKARITKIGTVFALVGPGVILYSIFKAGLDGSGWNGSSFHIFIAGMAIEGLVSGIIWGPLQAIYADSMRTGERSLGFAWIQAAWLSGSVAGPLCTIIYFSSTSNAWHLRQLATIIASGLAITVLPSLLTFFVSEANVDKDDSLKGDGNKVVDKNESSAERDDGALRPLLDNVDKDEQPDRASAEGGQVSIDISPATIVAAKDADRSVPGEKQPLLGGQQRSSHASGSGDDDDANNRKYGGNPHMGKWAWAVPYILFVSNMLVAVGSGMTVKFFPLWWKEDNHLSPTDVQIIYVFAPLAIMVVGGIWVGLSRRIGRVQALMVSKIAGCSAMVLLVILFHSGAPTFLALVPVYLLRTSLMNGTYPIQESILMDCVPSEMRARWKSLDSITAFGWCGSAFLGGFIADKAGYTSTFLVTAALQFVGGVVLQIPLLFMVPRFERKLNDGVAER